MTETATLDSEETAEKDGTAIDATSDDQTDEPIDWEAKAKHWQKMSRKNEAAAKKYADKARLYDEQQEQAMSDIEKANKRAQEAEERVKALEIDTWRYRAAKQYGVDSDLIYGEDEDTINAAAKKLADAFQKIRNEKQPSTSVAGKRGKPLNVDQITEQDLKKMTPKEIVEAQKEGRLNSILTGNTN